MFKDENRHYSLRKLSVGLASVLIGISFASTTGNSVKADTVNGDNNGVQTVVKGNDAAVETDAKSAPEGQSQTSEAIKKDFGAITQDIKQDAINTKAKQQNTTVQSSDGVDDEALKANNSSVVQEDSSARGNNLADKNNFLKTKGETAKKVVAAVFRANGSETTLNLKSAKFINPKALNENKTEAVVKADPAHGIDPVKFASNGGFDPKIWGALASYKFNATNNPDIVIDLNHSSVTPNDQDIDPDTGKTIDEMTHVNLTYGINIYIPNTNYDGHILDYHEERDFKLTRIATKDAVTGKITYSQWTGTVTGKTNRESEWPTTDHPNMWNAAVGTINRVLTWDSFVNNKSGLALGMPLGPLTAGKGYTLQVPDDVAVNEFTDNAYTIDLNKDIHTVSDPLTWAASKNIDIYVNADKQTSSWKFVDDTGIDGVTDQALIDAHNDVLKTHEFNGYTDENVSLYIAVPAGYKLADNASIPTNYTFQAENNQPIEIHLVHEVETAIDKNHIPDGAKKSDGSNVTSEDFSETVTRHITINMPNHDGQGGTNAIDKTQTKTLTRTGDYDVVTKIMTFGPWSKDTFEAVPVPTVAGYTPSQDKINTADATDGFVDPKIEVTYAANDSTQTIHYVDEQGHELSTTDDKDQDGNVIGDSTVTVKTDEVGNVQVPKGWKLVDDHDQTTKVAYGNDDTIPVKNVKITHATIEVTSDTPHAKGDPIDPQVPTGAKYGAGLTTDDLNDVAYREIHFKLPASTNAEDYAKRLKDNGLISAHVDGTDRVIVRQEVAYKRTAIVDAITGEVKGYNPAGVMNQGWVPNGDKLVDAVIKNDSAVFNKVLIPQIAGYKAHLDDTKVTVAKLANGSHAALSQLFVSFMALPKPATSVLKDTKPAEIVTPATPVDIEVAKLIKTKPKATISVTPKVIDLSNDVVATAPDVSTWHVADEPDQDTYHVSNGQYAVELPHISNTQLHVIANDSTKDSILFTYKGQNNKYVFKIKFANGHYLLTTYKIKSGTLVKLIDYNFIKSSKMIDVILDWLRLK